MTSLSHATFSSKSAPWLHAPCFHWDTSSLLWSSIYLTSDSISKRRHIFHCGGSEIVAGSPESMRFFLRFRPRNSERMGRQGKAELCIPEQKLSKHCEPKRGSALLGYGCDPLGAFRFSVCQDAIRCCRRRSEHVQTILAFIS